MEKYQCPPTCKGCKNKHYCFDTGVESSNVIEGFEDCCRHDESVKEKYLEVAIEKIGYFLSNYHKIKDGNDLRGFEQDASMALNYIQARLERGKFKDLADIF